MKENIILSEDTIVAVATGVGNSGISIIRVSGPDAVIMVSPLFMASSGKKLELIQDRLLSHGIFNDGEKGIDEVLVSKMPGPHSYTGEDVVEINCHGGVVITKKILDLVLKQGARLSEPGEFTKRAFLNGRLDLTQAEAVMDMIGAKTEESAALSFSQLEGSLKKAILELESSLRDVMAHIAVNIDYPEYDIEDITYDTMIEACDQAVISLDVLLKNASQGKILRDGIKTAIIGRPNVGKSSLLNTLLQEKRAIVTHIPGTTRDVIEEYVNIEGIPFIIVDTAGLRKTVDLVEQIGVERSMTYLESADIILYMMDITNTLEDEDIQLLKTLDSDKVIPIANKTDLEDHKVEPLDFLMEPVKISIIKDEGIDAVKTAMVDLAYQGQEGGIKPMVTNVRHIRLLNECKGHFNDAKKTIKMGMPLELISIDFQNAMSRLREIIGEEINEDVINQIFENFCIGK
jgi:tRNA modification GTPase